jgi:hypothetical protein
MYEQLGAEATIATPAWEAFTSGDVATAARLAQDACAVAKRKSRRERQRVALVCLVVKGDVGRAVGLASEHLADYPTDDFVRRVRAAALRNEHSSS